MSEPSKAVFLSYASQDTEAAKKICDALRGAGVEVWFDQNELTGGDAWDQKIRKQIKDCALFMPIVSAATQARREGYFRLEWKLADDRTHLMARGTPFLVPVCIDDTKDWDAIVPDSFMNVQWTRLPGGETPPKFCARVQALLRGEIDAPARPRAPAAVASSEGPTLAAAAVPEKKFPTWVLALIVIVAVAAGIFITSRSKTPPVPAASVSLPSPAVTRAPVPTARDWPRDPELKRAHKLIYTLDGIPEDYALAEDVVKPLLAARPNDPEVVTVAAEVSQELVSRGFDTSQVRRALTQRLTERAVQLAPDSPEALGALGRYLLFINAQLGRAEELLRRAIELDPTQARYQRTLYYVLFTARKEAEADALGARMVALFPNDPLAAYDIARRYKDANDLALAEEWFDRTLAIAPVGFAMTWKAWFLLVAHGDVAGMKAVLDRIPERQRGNARVVNAFVVHAGITGQTATALNLLNAVGETWMTDFDFTGPKALLVGDLLQLDGRADLARLQYETALAEIRRKQEADPTDLRLRRAEVWVQLGLGHREEARAALRIVSQSLTRPARWSMRNTWWSGAIRACLLLDERALALTLLKEAGEEPQARLLLRNLFRVDPRMTPFRDDPEIIALLAEPEKPKTDSGGQAAATKADDKSVAVLAFANLSDDKGNEYFSDGISEELLNVLAKVPGLKVTARTSAFFFKGKNLPIPEIAKQLGVAYVIEGSVQRAADHVRITAQLIKAADGFHVWSEHFDRELKNVFALQDEIAGLIAKQLSLKLGTSSAAATASVNPQALEFYLQANEMMRLRDTIFINTDRVEELLNRALALEPNFARAHAMLAEVWVERGSLQTSAISRFGQRHSPERARIEAKARQAIALDPTAPEPHAALSLGMWSWWDRAGAENELRTALSLNPSHVPAHRQLGLMAMDDGRMDDAIAELKLAVQLDPLSQHAIESLARTLHVAGRYTEAIAAYDRALALADSEVAREHKAYALAQLGQKEAAVVLARSLSDEPFRFRTFAAAGARAEAEKIFPTMDPEDRAYHLFLLGRTEEGLVALNPAEMLSTYLHDVLFEPWYDSVREDPRFKKFLETLGVTEAHARAQAWRKAHPPEKAEAKK